MGEAENRAFEDRKVMLGRFLALAEKWRSFILKRRDLDWVRLGICADELEALVKEMQNK
jgi:hypothetical protein